MGGGWEDGCRRDEGGQVHGGLQQGYPAGGDAPVVHDAPIRPDLGHNLDADICSSSGRRRLKTGSLEYAPVPGRELHGSLTCACWSLALV